VVVVADLEDQVVEGLEDLVVVAEDLVEVVD